MNKQQLKQEQPIAYRTLSHALKNDKLAHAYLFHGIPGTPKLECAQLLAQSILCGNRDQDGFACEECADCRRIKAHQMTDFIYLDREKDLYDQSRGKCDCGRIKFLVEILGRT